MLRGGALNHLRAEVLIRLKIGREPLAKLIDSTAQAGAAGEDGTGRGEPTDAKYAAVRRTIGAVRASVAVRYKVPAPTK